jgi:hypothetical protein
MNQNQQILNHLRNGKSITPLEALNEYGCLRLGARIHDLKRAGHNIASESVELPNGKRVASYRMGAV